MFGEYPAQIARTLQGKIASTNSETYQFFGRLKKVQAELNSQRETHFTDLSSENRDLKEMDEQLQGLQEELNKVNNQILNQTRQLEELQKAKAEVERAQKAEKELRKESAMLKKELELLAKEKAEAKKRAAMAGAAAFRQAMDLTEVLAPWVNFDFYDGKHYVKDHKIWLGDKMVLDAALYKKALEEAEEEEEASPGTDNLGEKDGAPVGDVDKPKGKPEGGDARRLAPFFFFCLIRGGLE